MVRQQEGITEEETDIAVNGKWFARSHLFLVMMLVFSCSISAQENPNKTIILDTTGFWRVYHVFKPPVVKTDTGLETVLAVDQKWLHKETSPPPDNWKKPDFDDSKWLRGPARIAAYTECLAKLCLRGKFTVTDPAKMNNLSADVSYYGGAIIYINGKELKRGHLKQGDAGEKGFSDGYTEAAYFLGQLKWNDLVGTSERMKDLTKARTRKLENIPIPGNLLRKGINVLAIEIIRSPQHKCTKKTVRRRQKTPYTFNWGTCSIRQVQLTAENPNGIIPNSVRPAGFQVWNSNIMAADFAMDFGDPIEKLQPVEITGVRNGSFSGKVVVGSNKVIGDLKATISNLKSSSGKIPSSCVRIRYSIPWGKVGNVFKGGYSRYPAEPMLLGALVENPLPDIPVRTRKIHHYYGLKTPNQPAPVFGAVTAVWVTVDIPSDAKAGIYTGKLTITAKGEKSVNVPIKLTVENWKLPVPDNYQTWVELTQSPDTLVEEYKLERWSDRHFEMMTRSMKHLNRIGSRVLYVPVICHANIGNEESMVRWIKKGDNKYDWDFTLMDKYLDLAEKHMGKPKLVCLWVWEKFLFPTVEDPVTFEKIRPRDERRRPSGTPGDQSGSGKTMQPYIGKGPMVTILDPKTGKLEKQFLPYLLKSESKTIWKPFFEKVMKHLAKRKWKKGTVMLGTPSDVALRNQHFAFFNEVAPGLKWVNHSHYDLNKLFDAGGAKIGYNTTVFGGNIFPGGHDGKRLYGWKKPELHAYLLRNWHGSVDYFSLTMWRHLAEVNIAGNQRGVGHLGADFWKVIKDKRGTRKDRIFEKCPESTWRSNDICTSVLAPGPDGPVATIRYEMMREGVQECEARIFIEKALLASKIKGDLAKRCQDALDERIHYLMLGMSDYALDSNIGGRAGNGFSCWWNRCGIYGHTWFITSGWEERTRKLYQLAGKVARASGAN